MTLSQTEILALEVTEGLGASGVQDERENCALEAFQVDSASIEYFRFCTISLGRFASFFG